MNCKEKNIYKRVYTKDADYTVWMGFPGIYSFSMSSLGYLWMFKTLDEADDINVERVCSDTSSTNVKIPDLFGFSFTFDMDFLTIFSMLDKYSIPKLSKDRDNFPLIFAGGPVVTANPEPYRDIFDFFIIGDGEDINLKTVNICKKNKDKPKNELLKLLSEIEGIYVPKYPKNVIKQTKRLTECIYTPILSEDAFFKDTFIIEMSRGCANRCGFCLASYLNLPLRSVPNDALFDAIDKGLNYTNKIALLGAQVSAHPKFYEVLDYIYKKIQSGQDIELGISSLRIDAVNENVIKTLVAAGQKNTTLAIEAGSKRLRKVINKNIDEEQIFKAVKIARENGLKGVKLYGMLGIPTETQDDINAIIELGKKLKSENKGFDISFGFSSFVPKPHTPFQWVGREDTKSLEAKSNYIKKEFHKIGISVNVSSIKWDYWQAVLSRGNSSLSGFLIDVYKNGGKLGAFKASAKEFNIDTDYFALANYDLKSDLPWDFIQISPGKEFLIKENNRLLGGN